MAIRGIGKSTIVLQVVARLAQKGVPCAYISGEEAPAQVRMRARRLGLEGAPLNLAAATSVRDIVATLDGPDAPKVVVIDSIQTMYVDSVESAPGTVSQVRTSAQELIRAAKRHDICLLLVGHVTKDGQIAGPRVLEHMVDCVLYFEGERGHQFRILRAVKNRYGPTDEIGVFEMSDAGLLEVANPSALFLADRGGGGAILAAAPYSLAWKAAGRYWWKSRPWSPPRHPAPRGARWWGGTATAWPWCWRCWMPAVAWAWRAMMFT